MPFMSPTLFVGDLPSLRVIERVCFCLSQFQLSSFTLLACYLSFDAFSIRVVNCQICPNCCLLEKTMQLKKRARAPMSRHEG